MRLSVSLIAAGLLWFCGFALAQNPVDVPTLNRSATITAGNTFQQVVAAGTGKQSLTIQNNNANGDKCWIFIGSGTATQANSILLDLVHLVAYARYFPYVPSDSIQATCANAGDTLYIDVQGSPGPGTPTVDATVTVTNNPSGPTLNSTFVGLGFEKMDIANPAMFTVTNTALVTLWNRIGPMTCRFGANGVRVTPWVGAAAGKYDPTGGTSKLGQSDIDRFSAFLTTVNAKAVYGIQMDASAGPSTAAAEVAYVNARLHVHSYEFDNEPDLSDAIDATYEARWTSFANAVLAQVPSAKLVGPGTAQPPSYNQDIMGRVLQTPIGPWTQPFVYYFANHNSALGSPYLSGVVKHYYFASQPTTLDLTLAGDANLNSDILNPLVALAGNPSLGNLDVNLLPITGFSLPPLPLGAIMEEAGTHTGGGVAGISNAWGSANWTIDLIFQNATQGMKGVILHGGEGALYSPILTDDASLPQGDIVLVEPGYYGLLAFSQAAGANGGQLMTATVQSGPALLSAYAIARNDGSFGIILNNKDRSATAHASVTLPRAVSSASAMQGAAPSLDSTSGFTLGSATVNTDGSWSPTSKPVTVIGNIAYVTVPPGSFQVITAQ
jgi:hypothetical protein